MQMLVNQNVMTTPYQLFYPLNYPPPIKTPSKIPTLKSLQVVANQRVAKRINMAFYPPFYPLRAKGKK